MIAAANQANPGFYPKHCLGFLGTPKCDPCVCIRPCRHRDGQTVDNEWMDLAGQQLSQARHYRLTRDIPDQGAEFYVAVHNKPSARGRLQAQLRVRWSTDGTPLCPWVRAVLMIRGYTWGRASP